MVCVMCNVYVVSACGLCFVNVCAVWCLSDVCAVCGCGANLLCCYHMCLLSVRVCGISLSCLLVVWSYACGVCVCDVCGGFVYVVCLMCVVCMCVICMCGMCFCGVRARCVCVECVRMYSL